MARWLRKDRSTRGQKVCRQIKDSLSRARGAKGRGVVFCFLWAAGILSYSAYICESCYWCNCIEVLAAICSPLGGPGSSCRQWSGYVRRITAADVLTEKKLPFQIFPTAANKIQMLDWSCFLPLPLLPSISLFLSLSLAPSSVLPHPFLCPLPTTPRPFTFANHLFSCFHLALLPSPSQSIHPRLLLSL